MKVSGRPFGEDVTHVCGIGYLPKLASCPDRALKGACRVCAVLGVPMFFVGVPPCLCNAKEPVLRAPGDRTASIWSFSVHRTLGGGGGGSAYWRLSLASHTS
uniref:Uncharacterized protein n=1 Tax=Eutreptiella gymnastica TaxID=73025 RepID=A0A7S1HY72_9EUGL